MEAQHAGIETPIMDGERILGRFMKYHGLGSPQQLAHPGDLYFDISQTTRAIYVCMWGSWRHWTDSMEPIVHPAASFMNRFLWASATVEIGWYTAEFLLANRQPASLIAQSYLYDNVINNERTLGRHIQVPRAYDNIPSENLLRSRRESLVEEIEDIYGRGVGEVSCGIPDTSISQPIPSLPVLSSDDTYGDVIYFVVYTPQDYADDLPLPQSSHAGLLTKDLLCKARNPTDHSAVDDASPYIEKLCQFNTRVVDQSNITKQQFRNLEAAHARSELSRVGLEAYLRRLSSRAGDDRGGCPDKHHEAGVYMKKEEQQQTTWSVTSDESFEVKGGSAGGLMADEMRSLQNENRTLREQNQALMTMIQSSHSTTPSRLPGPSSWELDRNNVILQSHIDTIKKEIQAERVGVTRTRRDLSMLRESMEKHFSGSRI